MHLTPEDLVPYLIGHLWLSRDGVAMRATPQQIEYFADAEAQLNRVRMSAGVQLGFRSDASTLRLELGFAGHARNWIGLDLEVDGVITDGYYREDRPSEARVEWSLGPAGQTRELRVHLPHTCITQLRAVELDAAETVDPLPRRARRLLAIGDSITQGMSAHGPARSYVNLLADLLEAEALNQGVGGHIWAPGSLDTTIEIEPDLIVIAFGTNDWSRGVTGRDLRPRIEGCLAQLRRRWPEAPIAAISPIYRKYDATPEGQPPLQTYGRFIQTVAAESEGVTPIDGLELMPHLSCMFDGDGTHPNDAGMAHMAQRLYPRVAGLLQ